MNKLRRGRLRALNNQIRRLDRHINNLQRQSDRLIRWRLLSFLIIFLGGATLLLTWGALFWAIGTAILLLPFLMTVNWHRQIETSILRHRLLRDLKMNQLARLTLDWDLIPVDQNVAVSLDHPFAFDLDLIGERSLARLIDRSLTQEGGQRLREWLLETEPDLARISQRQKSVAELIDLSPFCDRLLLNALISGDPERSGAAVGDQGTPPVAQVAGKWSGERLLNWLDTRFAAGKLRLVMILLILLVPINFVLLYGYLAGWVPPAWMATWFIYAAILLSQSRKVEPTFRDAAFIYESLRQLSAVFHTIEKRSFASKPGLTRLLQPLREGSRRPSQQLRRANRLLAAIGLRLNPALAILLNAVFPWDIFFAYRLQKFKEDLADCLPEWLGLWYELEALFGLANFAYLNPGIPFAQLSFPADVYSINNDNQDPINHLKPPFQAVNIAHPLIAAEERVGNDFQVGALGSITIVTGSNMAGKSSFLRTLGVNIRLALAGAPVLADSLELVPFRVAASISVTDSVTDGFSYFYAEVRRLKAILEELQRPHAYPLFFLIDEIFRGTNNRERLIGSRSYVKALLGGNGTGAIATHDLELVKLANVNTEIRNAHFRDRVQGDLMVFDYKLHDGPCPTTNALRIMELAGLPVEEQISEDKT